MKRWIAALTVVVGTLAGTRDSEAGVTYVAGNVCFEGAKLHPWGATNTSTTTTLTVNCPLTTVPSISTISMAVYDRHTSANITCNYIGFDLAGNIVFNVSKSSSGGGPGAGFSSATAFLPVSSARIVTAQCTIPVATSGGTWQSHIVGFELS